MQTPAPSPALRRSPDAATHFADALRDAFCDVVLGGACAGCGRPGRTLCPSCAGVVAAWMPQPVERPGFGPAVAATTYCGLAADLMVAHKDRDAVALSGPLGAALARAVVLDPALVGPAPPAMRPRLLLVPVPSSREARRRRGYDHTLRLARSAARHLCERGLDARAVVLLERGHAVRDQAGLGLEERAGNQRGSMRIATRFRPGTDELVVVVDDIITTGATVLEAVRALAAGGVGVHLVAAVAHTPRRTPVPGPPRARVRAMVPGGDAARADGGSGPALRGVPGPAHSAPA